MCLCCFHFLIFGEGILCSSTKLGLWEEMYCFWSYSLAFHCYSKMTQGKCWLERSHTPKAQTAPKAELSLVGEGTTPQTQLDEVLCILLYILSGLTYKVHGRKDHRNLHKTNGLETQKLQKIRSSY